MSVEATESKERLDLGRQIIVFIGPEGSGKTTLAKRLADETNKPYIATGDIIRSLIEHDPGPLGDECRDMAYHHRYLDGATLIKILLHRFQKDDMANGFILDGGMRTVEETQDFRRMLQAAKRDLPLTVIHLRIPGWLGTERLLERRRKDDTIEGILGRLSKFYFQLGQRVRLIEQEEGWRLLHVPATGTIEENYRRIYQVLLPN